MTIGTRVSLSEVRIGVRVRIDLSSCAPEERGELI
jgi:hypothetical protein